MHCLVHSIVMDHQQLLVLKSFDSFLVPIWIKRWLMPPCPTSNCATGSACILSLVSLDYFGAISQGSMVFAGPVTKFSYCRLPGFRSWLGLSLPGNLGYENSVTGRPSQDPCKKELTGVCESRNCCECLLACCSGLWGLFCCSMKSSFARTSSHHLAQETLYHQELQIVRSFRKI